MKINITVLLFFFIFIESFSQNSPRVPERIRIDNMVLNISDDVIPIIQNEVDALHICLLYTSPSPRDRTRSRMPSSA